MKTKLKKSCSDFKGQAMSIAKQKKVKGGNGSSTNDKDGNEFVITTDIVDG